MKIGNYKNDFNHTPNLVHYTNAVEIVLISVVSVAYHYHRIYVMLLNALENVGVIGVFKNGSLFIDKAFYLDISHQLNVKISNSNNNRIDNILIE